MAGPAAVFQVPLSRLAALRSPATSPACAAGQSRRGLIAFQVGGRCRGGAVTLVVAPPPFPSCFLIAFSFPPPPSTVRSQAEPGPGGESCTHGRAPRPRRRRHRHRLCPSLVLAMAFVSPDALVTELNTEY